MKATSPPFPLPVGEGKEGEFLLTYPLLFRPRLDRLGESRGGELPLKRFSLASLKGPERKRRRGEVHSFSPALSFQQQGKGELMNGPYKRYSRALWWCLAGTKFTRTLRLYTL